MHMPPWEPLRPLLIGSSLDLCDTTHGLLDWRLVKVTPATGRVIIRILREPGSKLLLRRLHRDHMGSFSKSCWASYKEC